MIWYPTNPGAGPITPQQAAVVDAPLAAGGPYPLVLFSCTARAATRCSRRSWTALLAAQGFIVVAPPHPGNTIAEFPELAGTATAQVNSFPRAPERHEYSC